MKNIKLITDSGSDMPEDLIKKHEIGIVKLNVAIADEDVSNLSNEAFYAKMKSSPVLPKTSAPSPERFLKELKTDKDVIIINLAEKLSSTISAAKLAKDIHAESSESKIEVYDSLNGSIGQGLIVLKVAEMIEAGKTMQEIDVEFPNVRDNLVHYGLLETLENAIKGGRVNRTTGFIANALNIKALVEIKDGVVKPIDKARGSKNGIKKLVEVFTSKINEQKQRYHYTTLGICHGNAPDKVDAILEELKGKISFDNVIVSEIGPLMGTYAAEGAVLLAAL